MARRAEKIKKPRSKFIPKYQKMVKRAEEIKKPRNKFIPK